MRLFTTLGHVHSLTPYKDTPSVADFFDAYQAAAHNRADG
jgi:hypothetical protein